MTMVGATEIVVAEDFEYAEQADASAHVLAVAAGDGVDLGAGAVALGGEIDEFADLLDGETELADVADKCRRWQSARE